MNDPLRTDRLLIAGDVPERERDARVEQLLLLGLDHYFLGQHELAISVWTRVLFLDRGHARARAYIERARSAIAERQRESEELLHGGVAAFDRGDAGAARRLLTSAVERGAASEEALALLDRLDRLERVNRGATGTGWDVGPLPPDEPVAITTPDRGSRLTWIGAGLVAGLAVAAIGAWLWAGARLSWAAQSTVPLPATQLVPEPLPLPTPAEASLARAHRLHAVGRLHDALAALEPIRHGDPLRPRADALRAAIQRQLLEAAHAGQVQPSAEGRAAGPPSGGTSGPAMRCPKCQYISFGSDPRCRNCGYDFSMAAGDDEAFDLPMQGSDVIGPMADLPLSASSRPISTPPGPVLDSTLTDRSELPLFGADDDRPLVTPPAVPRIPLSVRRAAPVMPRPRGRQERDDEPQLDLEDAETFRSSRAPVAPAATTGEPQAEAEEVTSVPAFRRAIGALIDLVIMALIDAGVIYLTLRATGLEPASIGRLPKIPLGGFLLLLNGGYLVLFTAAGGQTIGKMATGIRVVPQDPGQGLRVPFGTAVVRAAAFAVSLLPAGLGFLPILFSPDGRALHDRLADTRVIRA